MRHTGQEYALYFQTVLEKDPMGLKVLERNVFVSSSEIKAEKEQPDHGNFRRYVAHWLIGIIQYMIGPFVVQPTRSLTISWNNHLVIFLFGTEDGY